MAKKIVLMGLFTDVLKTAEALDGLRLLGLRERQHVVHQPAGIVTQQRTLPARQRGPGFLEAARGLGITEQRAVEVRGE